VTSVVNIQTTSVTIRKHMRITAAFAFDHHFAVAGFRMVG
jgi:hypothetical protein